MIYFTLNKKNQLTQKIIINLVFFLIVLLLTSFNFKNNTVQCTEGVYKTYEDYLHGTTSLTDYGELKSINTLLNKTVLVFKKDKVKTKFELNKTDIWGIRTNIYVKNSECKDFRIYEGNIYQIISKGKIFIYGWGQVSLIIGDKILIIWLWSQRTGGLSISQGGEGELIKFNQKNLELLVANDPEISSMVQNIKLKDGVTLGNYKYEQWKTNAYNLILKYNNKN